MDKHLGEKASRQSILGSVCPMKYELERERVLTERTAWGFKPERWRLSALDNLWPGQNQRLPLLDLLTEPKSYLCNDVTKKSGWGQKAWRQLHHKWSGQICLSTHGRIISHCCCLVVAVTRSHALSLTIGEIPGCFDDIGDQVSPHIGWPGSLVTGGRGPGPALPVLFVINLPPFNPSVIIDISH